MNGTNIALAETSYELKKDRDRTFDFLKLYAMLSVVLDHSMQHMMGICIQSTQLYNWIFLSQMPIFMFTSGYFSLQGIKRTMSVSELVKKCRRIVSGLLIPFISFALILSIISGDNILSKSILYPQNSLWFLWVLMWMQLIMLEAQQITNLLTQKQNLKLVLSISLYLVGLIPVGGLFLWNPLLFDTKLIIYYSIFYLFGYLYSFIESKLEIFKSDKYRAICIPVLMCFLVCVMIKHPTIILDNETIVNIFYRLLGSFCAILLMLYISSFMVKTQMMKKVAKLGTLSLEMYYIHLLIIRLPFFNESGIELGLFIVKYVILVICSIVIIYIIKRFFIIDFIFFGKLHIKESKSENQ